MVTKSAVTGKYYEPVDCIYIMNLKQTALYLKHDMELLDVIPNKDNYLVFVFDKKETSDAYRLWQVGELK